MDQKQELSTWPLAFALFSMFFGGGNLIFPLHLGVEANSMWPWAIIGMGLTGILVPFLGVLVMVHYNGNSTKIFQFLGKKGNFLVMLFILSLYVPLGAAPRCVSLAHSSLQHFYPNLNYWSFGLVFCSLAYFVSIAKKGMLDILGKILTPTLLVLMAVIVGSSFFFFEYHTPISSLSIKTTVYKGAVSGYQTMDLMSSLFFSSAILMLLKEGDPNKTFSKKEQKKIRVAFGLGVLILTIVYVGICHVAAKFSILLQGIPMERPLVYLGKFLLGEKAGVIVAAFMSVACFTTTVALVHVFGHFLAKELFLDEEKEKSVNIVLMVLICLMGRKGIPFITKVTSPLLEYSYPLIILVLAGHFLLAKKRSMRRVT